MKRFAALCTATVLAATLTACNQTSGNTDADIAAIKAVEAQWNKDWAAHDLDKIMSHYADDSVLMVPFTPPSVGKAAITEGNKPMATDPVTALKFTAARVEVAKSGDVAWTQGSYTLTFTDPQSKQVINDHGSYVTTYRKQPDGSWKCIADIATSEVPPPAPAPATAAAPSSKSK
jgi:uncharacterized protein (TIGR02246 family)